MALEGLVPALSVTLIVTVNGPDAAGGEQVPRAMFQDGI
jgi:hypothetical protein